MNISDEGYIQENDCRYPDITPDYVSSSRDHSRLLVDPLSFLELTCEFLRNTGPSQRRIITSRSNTSPAHSFLLLLLIMALEAPQCGTRANILSQNPGLDPPRQDREALVAHKGALRNGENVIQLLQSPLLRLGDKQENHNKRNKIEPSVKAKSTSGRKRGKHAGERYREHSRPEQAGCDSP